MSRGKAGKERLGRGLEALLGDFVREEESSDTSEVRLLPVDRIRPNPFQPRKEFPPEELKDLSASIRANGLLQPLVVRPAPDRENAWELVAGERRLRAVAQLDWPEVPCWIREVEDQTLLVLALVENLQREALAPLEEAEGYRVLSESFGLTQGEIAEAVGKDRSTVANTLRLLQLPPSVRRLLMNGELSAGHARALLAVEDPVKAGALGRRAAEEGWPVRRIEEEVRGRRTKDRKSKGGREGEKDAIVLALEEELRRVLGTRVVLRRSRAGKGVIEIPFLGAEDFERIFALIAGREASEIVE